MDNAKIIEEFRANHGKVAMFGPMKLLLMTVRGAKSGKETIVPVAYTMEGEKFVIAASKGGAPTNPTWYFNLIANPDVKVELGDETFQARATNVTGDERTRLYNQHADQYPQFHEYTKKTTREIPVFLLERT